MIKGFILAAGFSTRLRPITEFIPKPLLPIAGEVLLSYIYRSLQSLGVDQIGINLHYKSEEIENYIKEKNLKIQIFHEKDILNTGGALFNAMEFLKDCPFIVHNADIYWDGDIKEAIDYHIKFGNSITLLVHDKPKENKLIVDDECNLLDVIKDKMAAYKLSKCFDNYRRKAFTGIAIYSPEVLALLPRRPSSVIDLWLKVIEEGLKVRVFHAKYSFWHDIGTPQSYARAVFDKLKRNFCSIYVHPHSSGCDLVDTEGNLVVERNVKIQSPLKAKNLIILPETEISLKGEKIIDYILLKDLKISISGWQTERENLTQGGSTRRYFREHGKVLCQWEALDNDFERTIKLGNFLRRKGFPVPEIIDIDEERKAIIFEDLGDLSLYSWLQCKRKEKDLLLVYKAIIERISILHWIISKYLSELDIDIPQFSYEYLRWESEYFLKECVQGVFKLSFSDFSNIRLQEELDILAKRLSKSQKVILHRDLQSQNIMLKQYKCLNQYKINFQSTSTPFEIYFIDYQSARLGPVGYDLASLLWDPYFDLNNKTRQELLSHYIEHSINLSGLSGYLNSESFHEEIILCRIQRHMQALGAYGFLSLKRGKKNFLKYIPSALRLLNEDLLESPIEFKILRELVQRLLIEKIMA